MPLTELVRMSKGKVQVSQEGASISSDPFSRPGSDCVELVWENGQIMMQGKSRKTSNSNIIPTIGPRPQDSRNPNLSKMTKFSTMDSVMADFPVSVPSMQMDLDHDVELVPWLNYPIEEPLHNDYTSDFLHELSGVTINDLPTEKHLGYRDRKSSFLGDNGHDSSISLKHGITSKASSSSEKNNRGESNGVQQFLLPFQHRIPRSGVSDISGNSAGTSHHFASRDPTVNPSSLTAFTGLRLQKLDAGQPGTNSGFSNFAYFSRPAALSRASHATVNPSKILENDDKKCVLSGSNPANSTTLDHSHFITAPTNANSGALTAKPAEELFSANQTVLREDISRNYAPHNEPCDAPMNNLGASGERNIEPVIATSSVCSANSAERTSDEPARNLKRKSRDTAESSGPSEEIEEESMAAKKRVSAQPGSKRTRASEVHNLSERRRRDRINEKMRALQELIPNCNKADKASMLDEAIEYLKTLQLQLQVLSMGSGMYMQPMMLQPGMQPIHGAHMPHFAPMGLGMGLGMGYGMNMLNMNNNAKMLPFQGQHYPVLGTGPTFPGMLSPTLQSFRHPSQGLPMSIQQQTPVVPAPMSAGVLTMPIGLNAMNVAGTSNSHVAPLSDQKDSNTQAIPSSVASNYSTQETNKVSIEGIQQSPLHRDRPQDVDHSEKTTEPANGKGVMLS